MTHSLTSAHPIKLERATLTCEFKREQFDSQQLLKNRLITKLKHYDPAAHRRPFGKLWGLPRRGSPP